MTALVTDLMTALVTRGIWHKILDYKI